MKKAISLLLTAALAVPVCAAEEVIIDGYTWTELEGMQMQSLDPATAFPSAWQVFDSSKVASETEIAESLEKLSHPRLIADNDDFERVKSLKSTDPYIKKWYADVETQGKKYMNSTASTYKVSGGALSTNVDDAAMTLAFLSRTCTDAAQAKKYADKCIYYLEAAAAYPDFNPAKMLNVGEISRGVAIAYDWIYDSLGTKAETVGAALAEKALTPVYGSVYKNRNNWNFVVNGGTMMAAIAFAEVDYNRSASVIRNAVLEFPDAMRLYYPDGAFIEASGYFSYASSYLAPALASLNNAFGTDWGLSSIEGFEQSGYFPIYTKGFTDEQAITYGDTRGTKATGSPLLFWLSERFSNTDFGMYQREASSNDLFSILWYKPEKYIDAASLDRLSGCYVVDGAIPYASFKDKDSGIFAGLKGGYNQESHGDLDIGTFFLGAHGKSYTKEMPNYSYNSDVSSVPDAPSESKFTRYTYYSHQPQGHNTLVFNPGMSFEQSMVSHAGFTERRTDGDLPYAVLDMSGTYSKESEYTLRGIMLDKKHNRVILSDNFNSEGDLYWFMHTGADITVNGNKAVLDIDGEKMYAEIVSGNGSFEIMDAQPMEGTPTVPAYDTVAHAGDKKLTVHLTVSGETELQICFSATENNANSFVPLKYWKTTYYGKGQNEKRQTVSVVPTDDATVDENKPDTPDSEGISFDMRCTTSYNRHGYMRFKPQINGIIEHAVLKMYVMRNYGEQEDILSLYSANGNWNEEEITWNTALGMTDLISTFKIPALRSQMSEITADVTDYINGLSDKSDIAFGLKLKDRNGAFVQVCTKESGKGPVLEITYTKKEETVTVADDSNKLLSCIDEGSNSYKNVFVTEREQVLLPSADTYIHQDSSKSNENYVNSDSLYFYRNGNNSGENSYTRYGAWSMLQFDLSKLNIPNGTSVEKAEITLHLKSLTTGGDMYCYAATVEPEDYSELSWKSYAKQLGYSDGLMPQSPTGKEVKIVTIEDGADAGSAYRFDVTDYLNDRELVGKQSFIFYPRTPNYARGYFYSSECGIEEYMPKLTITLADSFDISLAEDESNVFVWDAETMKPLCFYIE